MNVFKLINLGVAFILELCMLASFGFWAGSLQASKPLRVITGLITIVVVITLWGVFAAPNSTMRLTQPWLFVFQLILFAAASLALYAAGQIALAVAMFGIWLISTILSLVWKQ